MSLGGPPTQKKFKMRHYFRPSVQHVPLSTHGKKEGGNKLIAEDESSSTDCRPPGVQICNSAPPFSPAVNIDGVYSYCVVDRRWEIYASLSDTEGFLSPSAPPSSNPVPTAPAPLRKASVPFLFPHHFARRDDLKCNPRRERRSALDTMGGEVHTAPPPKKKFETAHKASSTLGTP